MAYTQQQIDALREALAEGVLEVESAGRRIKYRSLAEMQQQLQIMEAAVTGRRPATRKYMSFQRD